VNLVRYKLQLIDQRNAGLRGLLWHTVEKTPLVICALGLMTGIVIERYAAVGLGPWLWALVAAILAGIPLCLLQKPAIRPLVAATIAMAAFASLGGIRLIGTTRTGPRDIALLAGEQSIFADLRGRIAGDIAIEDRTDWVFGRYLHRDLSSGFDLELSEARCLSGWQPVAGTVRVTVGEPIHDLNPGDSIQLYATLRRFRPPANPGSFDSKSFYERQGIRMAAFVEGRAGIETLPSGRSSIAFVTLQRWLRDTAHRMLRAGGLGDDDSYGLLEALLLGTRTDIAPAAYEAFRRTGLLHYVSLSGMHIGIVIGAVWQSARILGITRRRRAVLCAAAIVLFLLIVPPRSPVLRAGVIGLVFCGAAMARRRSEPANTLSLAAIIILVCAPLELFSAGWQLSFACVAGILLFSGSLEFLFYEAYSRLRHRNPPADGTGGTGYRVLRAVISLTAVGFAAWFGSAGLMLYHFYNITPLASIWTMLTMPVMTATMILGYIKMAASAVLPTAGLLLAPVTGAVSWLFVKSVELMAKVSASEIVIGHVPIWLSALYYAAALCLALTCWYSRFAAKVLAALLVAAFVACLGGLKWHRMNPSDVEVTCLSVGHGQAIVARLPHGCFLFDCGSVTAVDCGRRVVAPYLRWRGIAGLDGLFLSHSDIDHCNGLPEIMTLYGVNRLFVSKSLVSRLPEYGKGRLLREAVGTGWQSMDAGDRMTSGRAQISVLWPVECNETSGLTDNDMSLVAAIQMAGRTILLCSDIQQQAQRRMLSRYPQLRADAVIAPHHGSARSRLRGFMDSLTPQAVICSCDQAQMERAQRTPILPAGARTYFTCRDGAVTIRVAADGSMQIDTFAKSRGQKLLAPSP
jgi:competence protein ComEC